MQFNCSGSVQELSISQIYVAGWTGRDKAAVDHHIKELAEIGIAPPSQVPLYYRVSYNQLTQSDYIEVLGGATSGEVEPLLIQADGKIWIGLASDHTDRDLEAHSVAASKQACAKPVANDLWDFATVENHIDALELECAIQENGEWITYQKGTLESIRPLSELISASGFSNSCAMLCGTLPAIGGVRAATEYRMRLTDPVLNKSIRMDYDVSQMPIVV